MTELKTLKDIDDENDYSDGTCGSYQEKIKQEAIKWYKFNMDKPPKDRISGSDWLEFFNITEDNLK